MFKRNITIPYIDVSPLIITEIKHNIEYYKRQMYDITKIPKDRINK
jgi:hypothetical protein